MTIKNDPVQIDHGIPHMKIMIAGIICTLVSCTARISTV